MRHVTARSDGYCSGCSKRITKGDKIISTGMWERYCSQNCANRAFQRKNPRGRVKL